MKKNLTLVVLFFLCFSISFAQNWAQQGGDVDGKSAWDHSGTSVSMSADGNAMAIGAPHNKEKGADAGQVRVYAWNGTTWLQKGSDINGKSAGDRCGTSVSMSSDGHTVAVGAQGKYKSNVRIFIWKGSDWIQKGLNIEEEAVGDEFGFSVCLASDGNTVAIGAPGNSESGEKAGHVRVYRWLGEAWRQKGLDIDGEAAGDHSGFSVSMGADGNTVAVGAIFNDGKGQDAGHVRVFIWSGVVWLQQGADIDGEAVKDRSGWSVSLSSDGITLAIGAWGNDAKGTHTGHVRVYNWNGTTWEQKGIDIDGDKARDRSGWSVSMSSDGNIIAIGATGNHAKGKEAGNVRVYSWSGTSWTQMGADIHGEYAGDQCGISISISSDGNKVAIGAAMNDGAGEESGHVRVFRY